MMFEGTVYSGKVHPVSAEGFGVGKSEFYDRARSTYDPAALAHIRKAVGKKDRLNIVELGCGTGLFTRSLLNHPEWKDAVAEMKCIDPNEGMRTVFERNVVDPRVHLSEGTFDNTGVPDGWADVILAASAFHWCSNLEEAMEELVRISHGGTTIAFAWIYGDRGVPWVREIDELLEPYHAATASSATNFTKWKRIFTLPAYQTHFGKAQEAWFYITEPTTLEGITALAFSRSGVAVQSEEEKWHIAERIKEVIKRGDGLMWLDEQEGIIEAPSVTWVVVMQRS